MDLENAKNMTPYFIAVLQGMYKVAEFLVSQGLADAKKKNSAGKSIEEVAQDSCSRRACLYFGLP